MFNDEEFNGQDVAKRQPNYLLSSEMLIEVEETFAMINGPDGVMDYRLLPIALKSLGMALTDLTDSDKFTDDLENFKVEKIDLNKFKEIVGACLKQPNWAAAEMVEAFNYFDKDHGGTVDHFELKEVFLNIAEPVQASEIEDQLREVDIDGDAAMCLSEWHKMIALTIGKDFIFDDSLYGIVDDREDILYRLERTNPNLNLLLPEESSVSMIRKNAGIRSFYEIVDMDIHNNELYFHRFRDKVVYVINVASQCGLAKGQFKFFKHIQEMYCKLGLEVILCPSDTFHQEPLDGNKVLVYITSQGFSIAEGGWVLSKDEINGDTARPVFKFLKEAVGKTDDISWNFEGKFLISRSGEVYQTGKDVEADIRHLLDLPPIDWEDQRKCSPDDASDQVGELTTSEARHSLDEDKDTHARSAKPPVR